MVIDGDLFGLDLDLFVCVLRKRDGGRLRECLAFITGKTVSMRKVSGAGHDC